jgi:hypothetical protein
MPFLYNKLLQVSKGPCFNWPRRILIPIELDTSVSYTMAKFLLSMHCKSVTLAAPLCEVLFWMSCVARIFSGGQHMRFRIALTFLLTVLLFGSIVSAEEKPRFNPNQDKLPKAFGCAVVGSGCT